MIRAVIAAKSSKGSKGSEGVGHASTYLDIIHPILGLQHNVRVVGFDVC